MLTKSNFVDLLVERYEVSKNKANEMYNAVFDTLSDVISSGEEIVISGLGRVKIVERAARNGHNPRTGEPVEIPAKKSPKFQFSKNVKDAVSNL